MTTPDEARKLADEVQQAVMNIPADHAVGGSLKHLTVDYRNGYVNGHRDARHAAAEAVLPLAAAARDMAAEVERLQRNLNLMTDLRNAAEDASNRHANTLGEIASVIGCGPTFLPSELVERVRAVVNECRGLSISATEEVHYSTCGCDACELERLKAENAKLQAEVGESTTWRAEVRQAIYDSLYPVIPYCAVGEEPCVFRAREAARIIRSQSGEVERLRGVVRAERIRRWNHGFADEVLPEYDAETERLINGDNAAE